MSEKDALLRAACAAVYQQSNDWSTVFSTVADYLEEHGSEDEWNLVLGLRYCVKESRCPECIIVESLRVPVSYITDNRRYDLPLFRTYYYPNVRKKSLIPSCEWGIMRYNLIELLTEVGRLSVL